MSKEYDLAIIGGGAGGFAAAIKANELGANAVMINDSERLPLGGTCVNVGCVPSKTLIHAAEVAHGAAHIQTPGVSTRLESIDFASVVDHEIQLVDTLRKKKYEDVASDLGHVATVDGRAVFVSPYEIEVNDQRIKAKSFIIATGSTTTPLDVEGLQEAGYLTHLEAVKLKQLPEELTIIGGGPQGLEWAQMYARFGSKVTILQQGAQLLRGAEPQHSDKLRQILESEGITIYTGVTITTARLEDNKKVVTFTKDGGTHELFASEILLAAGKTPNTASLGLDKAGVKTDDKKAVEVSASMQTSQPHIYAVGDVTNQVKRLETTAGREGSLAATNALTSSSESINYDAVPTVVFTDPQYASVGLTEAQQMDFMKTCSCRTVSFEMLPKAIIIGRTEGLISMAVHPQTEQILGVHILAPNAGDLIAQAMTLVSNKNTLDDVINSVPMFPTMSEAIKLVATSFKKDISKLSCCI